MTYEGAVSAPSEPPSSPGSRRSRRSGSGPELLEVFLREVVDMTDEEWQRFLSAPVYPDRVAAAARSSGGRRPVKCWMVGFSRMPSA